jgi:hypothetical protein
MLIKNIEIRSFKNVALKQKTSCTEISGVTTGGARGGSAPSVNGFAPLVKFLTRSKNDGLFYLSTVIYYIGGLVIHYCCCVTITENM